MPFVKSGGVTRFRPAFPFTVKYALLVPTTTKKTGVLIKEFPDPESVTEDLYFNGSYKTYGGTEKVVNDLLSIEDTATIETYYRPDIKSDCRICRLEDGAIYEILSEPEDIDFRHQYLRFKARRVKGGA